MILCGPLFICTCIASNNRLLIQISPFHLHMYSFQQSLTCLNHADILWWYFGGPLFICTCIASNNRLLIVLFKSVHFICTCVASNNHLFKSCRHSLMILWWSIVHLHVYIASNSHLLVQIMLTFFDDTFVVHCSFAHNFHFNSHLFYWSHAGVYYTLVGHCSFAHSFHSNSHLFYWSHAGVYYTLVVHCSFAHSFQQLLAFLKSCRHLMIVL